MNEASLTIARWMRLGAPVHAVALSGDGRHVLVGTEHDLRLLDRWGNEHFRRSQPPAPGTVVEPDMPFSLVALAPDLSLGLAALRAGELYRMDFAWQGDTVSVHWQQEPIRVEPNDLYSLSLAPEAEVIALGHLGPALTVLDTQGRQRWRRHPQDHNPTDGKTWAVALSPDGETLYVGSSGAARHLLAALDSSTGALKAGQRPAQRVTALAPLPAPLAVAAVHSDVNECRLVAYVPDLREESWQYAVGMGARITALVSDPVEDLVAIGSNTGHVVLLQASSGAYLAQDDTLGSAVLSLSVADGRYLVAGLQNGQMFYLEYTPAVLEEEFEL